MPGFSVNDLMSSPGTTSNFVQGTSLSAGVGPPDGVPILPQSSQRVRDDNLEAYRNAMNVLDFIINHRGKAVETASPSPSYFQGFSPVDRSSRPDMMSRYYPPLHAPYPYGAIFSGKCLQNSQPIFNSAADSNALTDESFHFISRSRNYVVLISVCNILR